MLHSGSFPRHRDPLNAHWVHGCYWVHSARCWQARDVEQAILQSGHTRVFGLALMVGNGHTLQNGVSTIYHNLLGMTVWPSHTRGWVQSWPEQSKFSFLVCRSITKTNKGAIVLHLSTNEQRRHLSTECWTLTAAVPPWLSCPCGWSTTWGSPSQLFVLDDPWNPQVVSTLGGDAALCWGILGDLLWLLLHVLYGMNTSKYCSDLLQSGRKFLGTSHLNRKFFGTSHLKVPKKWDWGSNLNPASW